MNDKKRPPTEDEEWEAAIAKYYGPEAKPDAIQAARELRRWQEEQDERWADATHEEYMTGYEESYRDLNNDRDDDVPEY